MSSIMKLPYELVFSVLRSLGNIRFLPSSILTCRHFYISFKEHPSIMYDLIQHQIGPQLLPYAVAILEASRIPSPPTDTSIQALLDALFNEPAKLLASLHLMPLSTLLKIGYTHDVIENLSADFSLDAWNLLSQDNPKIATNLVLSPAEYFRFQRAFYRIELFLRLFGSKQGKSSEISPQNGYNKLLSQHSPWENEQLGCVHDYLEKRISKATYDIVAHDIEFGELEMDYLTLGGDNHWKQRWISRGVEFIYQVMKENSYHNQHALLKSTFSADGVSLCDALSTLADDGDGRFLNECTEDEIEALSPRRGEADADEGPYQAWSSTHQYLPRGAWVMYDMMPGVVSVHM
ncbi:hypothetical protein F4779DRAFT_611798 [Xylariaceae sp. FL0662B]|nr:hypothetical protein F4779DRAFT_611798 [Xylariaceae sp. FL0662B]